MFISWWVKHRSITATCQWKKTLFILAVACYVCNWGKNCTAWVYTGWWYQCVRSQLSTQGYHSWCYDVHKSIRGRKFTEEDRQHLRHFLNENKTSWSPGRSIVSASTKFFRLYSKTSKIFPSVYKFYMITRFNRATINYHPATTHVQLHPVWKQQRWWICD